MPPNLRNRRNNPPDSAQPRVVEVDTDEEAEITRATAQQQERNQNEKAGQGKHSKGKHSKGKVYKTDADDDDEEAGISLLDVIRVIVTLVVLVVGLSYYVTAGESYVWGFESQRPWWMRYNGIKQFLKGPVNLTPSELALYNGSDPSLPIYLALNGTIIDVSANPSIYGPGGGYHFFVGRDASRAFVTGCFQEDLTNDMTGVEEMYIPIEDDDDSQHERALTKGEKQRRHEAEVNEAREKVRAQVSHWVGFYSNHKKYFAVGHVILEDDEDRETEKLVLCEGAQHNRPRRSELNKQL
ncbi:putative heme/steroid binding domain protein [Talaromyces proteolyticus]|uniref:Heme/steroid binding domain protein n=1 Tax=Talaromyces proteolyticus TaxID=1131652 RepID=A0AAD4KSY7_9EURO|nr:putative heme/steroid binding domain protein [Talaromyces proteolyticus]KAH8698618.1 putative heme/steroid binding domain protein [Talaromyces proteolyticus]